MFLKRKYTQLMNYLDLRSTVLSKYVISFFPQILSIMVAFGSNAAITKNRTGRSIIQTPKRTVNARDETGYYQFTILLTYKMLATLFVTSKQHDYALSWGQGEGPDGSNTICYGCSRHWKIRPAMGAYFQLLRRASAEANKRAYYAVSAHFRPVLVSSSNLGDF